MDEYPPEPDQLPLIPPRPYAEDDGAADMVREVAEGKRFPVSIRLKGVADTAGRGIKLAVEGTCTRLEGPAARVHKSATARSEARTEEARQALLDANRKRRDALRDVRRDRKAFENARKEVAWWNVWNGERRAARQVVRDSVALARDAREARREARRAYPLSLPALAVRCHAAHLVPVAVWNAVSDAVAADVAMGASVVAAVSHALLGLVGARNAHIAPATDEGDGVTPTAIEKELLERLSPKSWHAVAQPRGLTDVVSAGAKLTESGITAKLTLNGTFTLDRLKSQEAQLRAALRLPEGVRLELREGSTGGHARITLRTRSAADGIRLTGWSPGCPWGIDTVTGQTIPVPVGRRMLVAGTSGSGKSWSARPILAEASERDDHRLVILDMKRIEARLWKHRARIAIDPEAILSVLEELVAEMYRRLDLIPDGRDTVEISSALPRITVFVDEGSELISESKGKKDAETGFDPSEILRLLRTLARMARAAEIVLVWATQKPMLSGDSPGLDTQISAQITCRMSLAVATQKEATVIFGDDAVTEGWLANKLPMPGVAMLRDSNTAKPHHIKMRAMSPQDVMNLPPRPVWSRQNSSTGATVTDIEARKLLETVTLSAVDIPEVQSVRVPLAERCKQVLAELHRDPCRKMSAIARTLGVDKQTVRRALAKLEQDGAVYKDGDDCWQPVD